MKKAKTIILPKVFDKRPDLKKKALAFLDKIPKEKIREDWINFKRFVKGEATWAEIKGYPKTFLKLLTKAAYAQYRSGNTGRAEILLKGLAVIDHKNWYYRALLGSIYQKRKQYDAAVEEYSTALYLNNREVSCTVNRGECYLKLKKLAEAKVDFQYALQLDPGFKTPWAKRSKVLMENMR